MEPDFGVASRIFFDDQDGPLKISMDLFLQSASMSDREAIDERKIYENLPVQIVVFRAGTRVLFPGVEGSRS